MKDFLIGAFSILAVLVLYLLIWPTDLAPTAWSPTPSKGYEGPFAPNTALADIELIDLGEWHGPEDVAAREEDGVLALYTSTQNGKILKIDPRTQKVDVFAETGGVPLGIEFDNAGHLIVADAFRGLLSISVDGRVSTLTNQVDDSPILYADDLDFGPDGTIYFSDASTKFGAEAVGTTSEAAVLDIMEHGHNGRLLAYDPKNKTTRIVADGFSFANGVAAEPDGQSVLLAVTAEYSVVRVYTTGPQAGEQENVLVGLPGFPDNINRGPALDDGTPTFLVGIAGPRVPIADVMADRPFGRKVLSRFPAVFRPEPKAYGFVIQFTDDGNIVRTWQDPAGGYPVTTGGLVPGDGFLYVSSLEAHALGRIPYP